MPCHELPGTETRTRKGRLAEKTGEDTFCSRSDSTGFSRWSDIVNFQHLDLLHNYYQMWAIQVNLKKARITTWMSRLQMHVKLWPKNIQKKKHIKLGLNKHQCNNSTRLHKIILPQKKVIQVWNNIHKVEYINILIFHYPLKFLISKVDG